MGVLDRVLAADGFGFDVVSQVGGDGGDVPVVRAALFACGNEGQGGDGENSCRSIAAGALAAGHGWNSHMVGDSVGPAAKQVTDDARLADRHMGPGEPCGSPASPAMGGALNAVPIIIAIERRKKKSRIG